MKVIDIVDRIYLKDKDNFKFWVNSGIGTSSTCINWEYKDGYVRSVDNEDNFFYYIYKNVYKLTDDVEIIEDKPEEKEIKELPPLEYIKFNFEQSVNDINNTITYMSTTVTTDLDTELLALIINRLIKEVEDLKHKVEVTDKELEDHKKDLFSHNGAPITLTTGLENSGIAIGKIADLGLNKTEALEVSNKIRGL